jgi:hypothetical protein
MPLSMLFVTKYELNSGLEQRWLGSRCMFFSTAGNMNWHATYTLTKVLVIRAGGLPSFALTEIDGTCDP